MEKEDPTSADLEDKLEQLFAPEPETTSLEEIAQGLYIKMIIMLTILKIKSIFFLCLKWDH